MTYAQAKMIVWNWETYSADRQRAAAIVILGTLGASAEDIQQATWLITNMRSAAA